MRDEPGGADLLQIARETLLAEVLPGLGGGQRYATLMVANALRLVERELRAAGRAGAAPEGAGIVPRAMAGAIRAGRHDGDAALYATLHARAIAAVAITRPDFLTAAEREQDAQPARTMGEVTHGSDGRA